MNYTNFTKEQEDDYNKQVEMAKYRFEPIIVDQKDIATKDFVHVVYDYRKYLLGQHQIYQQGYFEGHPNVNIIDGRRTFMKDVGGNSLYPMLDPEINT